MMKLNNSNFLGAVAHKKIVSSWDIYVIAQQGTVQTNYGFSSTGLNVITQSLTYGNSGAGTSPGFYWNPAFADMIQTYGLFKINGVSMTYRTSYNQSSATFITVPPISFSINPGNLTGATIQDNYKYDNALRIQPLNEDSKPISKYYSFPGVIFSTYDPRSEASSTNSINQPMCGNKLWMSTVNIRSTPIVDGFAGLVLAMGSTALGPVAAVSPEATGSTIVGTLTCTGYFSFCAPYVRTQFVDELHVEEKLLGKKVKNTSLIKNK